MTILAERANDEVSLRANSSHQRGYPFQPSNMGSLADEKCRGDVEPAAESHISDPSELYIDPVEEKRLLRKLDIYLAPVMTLIFLMAYLDRSNIGNAASAGMLEDLGMSSSQLGSMLYLRPSKIWMH
jgi:hypothetical protein